MSEEPASRSRPNVVVILADDMGYSDIGCYGGEIDTPNVDRLAAGGLRMSQFYNTARCSPSRVSLLTGLHPHQTGIGILTADDRPDGYAGTINNRCVTMAEILRGNGYATYATGKWHLTGSMTEPDDGWPTRRGFDRFYGTLLGGNYWNPATLNVDETPVDESELPPDFYYTDAISDAAVDFLTEHRAQRVDQPFFLYVAYTAPHWPLHAPEADVAAYRGRFDAGWDELRRERLRRLLDLGVLEPTWPLSDRDPEVPPWSEVSDCEWEARRMEVYAAQVSRMDHGVGRIVEALRAGGDLDNTLVIFLSDNGGSAEGQPLGYVDETPTPHPAIHPRTRDGRRVFRGNSPAVMPGGEETYMSYGRSWANLSNTPFREYKCWVHEGGIATPFIAHWPAGLDAAGTIDHRAHQLTDIMPTVLEATGCAYPQSFPRRDLLPPEGVSMLPTWRGEEVPDRALYWEHEGNAAIRRGRWKLVRKFPGEWELYDIVADRTELNNVADDNLVLVAELSLAYSQWAKRCKVIPREFIVDYYRRRGGA